MSRDTDDASDKSTSRRTALKSIGAGAAIVGFGPAVSAAKSAAEASLDPDSGDCYYEYYCSGEQCQYGGYVQYRRECCDFGEVTCDSWKEYGCC